MALVIRPAISGLATIFSTTNRGETQIYIHGGRFNGGTRFSKYSSFRIENEETDYKLHFDTLLAGIHSIVYNNGAPFSTMDDDNDSHENNNCAHRGGFWYKACSQFFPNGMYQPQEEVNAYNGIIWKKYWLNTTQSLRWIELMIRTQ